MTRTIIQIISLSTVILIGSSCSPSHMDQAEIDHQEVSMAKNASNQVTELEYELNAQGELSESAKQTWEQAKALYLNASDNLLNTDAQNLDQALDSYNQAWDALQSTYQSLR